VHSQNEAGSEECFVRPNVRANLETTAWRKARATDNAHLHCGAGFVARRWLSG
jgi:hypothetical protein